LSTNWTSDQWNAINARGGSLLVSAAAGSGKTAVLVERVIGRILDDVPPVDIDRLLVVTFSKASAAEMRSRVAKRIRERLKTTPDDPHLLRQQMLLNTARISTIHSFCYELVRQNFAQLGLSHDLRIGDNQELDLLLRGALQDVLARRYAQQDDSGFFDLVELVSGSRNDREMEKLVESLYHFLRSHPFYRDWIEEKRGYYNPAVPIEQSEWGKIIMDYAADGLAYSQGLLSSALYIMDEPMYQVYAETFIAEFNGLMYASEVAQNGSWDQLRQALDDICFGRLPALRGYTDGNRKNMVLDCRNQVKKIVKELREKRFCASAQQHAQDIAFLAPRISALFDTVLELDERYQAVKQERHVLDYSDLEHMALQLLVNRENGQLEKTELAQQLSQQLEEILVDEYQDTNAVQEMIFATLSRDQQNLFFVGDIKQSIYRFRQAMPELFIDRKEHSCDFDGKNFPACINLDRNFRSRSAVTETVNYLFRMLMSKKVGEIEYNHSEELVCGASYPEDIFNHCITEFHLIKTDKTKEEPRLTEAKYTAAYVHSLLQSKMPVGRGDQHAIRPEDICILLRSHKNRASDYAEALAEYQVPAWANVEEGFLESEEIAATLALLQAVDNPLLDMSVTHAMMSPIFGFTADQVAQVRSKNKYGSMYQAVQAAAEGGNVGCIKFLEVLEDLRHHSAWESAERVIRRLYEKTNFLRIAQVMPAGKLRCQNLRLLADYAAEYEAKGFRGVSGFLGFINHLKQQEGDLAPASASAGGAVTIRSIHSSKGLEYPVVILADMDKQLNRQDVRKNTQIHSRLGFACKRRDSQRMIQFTTVPLEAVRIEAEREQLSEELRILYVALTRAQEKLVLMSAVENPESKLKNRAVSICEGVVLPWAVQHSDDYFDWVLSAVMWHADGELLRDRAGVFSDYSAGKAGTFKVVFSDWEEQPLPQKKQEFVLGAADPAMVTRFAQNTAFRYPYAEESVTPSKFSVSQLSHQGSSDLFCAARPAFMNQKGMTAAQKGSATHHFMQYADYDRAAVSVEQELQRLVELGFIDAKQAQAVDCAAIGRFFGSDMALRMKQAPKLLREIRFMGELTARDLSPYTDKVKGSEPVLLKGVADCVLLEQDGAVVLDYKTDRVNTPEELVERYSGQLTLYARMLKEYLGCPVKECWIYSFALGKALRVC